ncbi:MAG TPA: protein phosphatase CheZ [Bacteroidota bacterium]|nr:protein phosphatase CheZ [Bacteroidota bacterium]
MKDLLQLLRDTIPLLENVRNSIQDSAGRIPKASDQLSKVSEATESATVEILDLVEEMTNRFTKAEERLKEVKASIFEMRKNVRESLSILLSTPYGTLAKERYEELIQIVFSYYNDSMAEQLLKETETLFTTTKNDYMNIAIALQVQDITAQQLVGVAEIINSIQQQLWQALQRFDQGMFVEEEDPAFTPTKTYDINAQYTKAPERQLSADEIVRQWQEVEKNK